MQAQAAPTPPREQPHPATQPREALRPRVELSRGQWALVGIVIAGALVIAGIGFVGSYHAVAELAERKGFGSFAAWFPIGLDFGIGICVALDLLLTWLRIPFPLLRPAAWTLTAATVVFNAWSAYPDMLAMAMHATTPCLFILVAEAARHAIARAADINAGTATEYPPGRMWLVAPIATARIWRAQTRHGLTTYREVVDRRRDMKVYRARMREEHGRLWWRSAERVLPLRMARYGLPLAEALALPDQEREERAEAAHQQSLRAMRRTSQHTNQKRDVDEELRRADEAAEKERKRAAEEEEARREEAERQRRLADEEEATRLAELRARQAAADADTEAAQARAQAAAEEARRIAEERARAEAARLAAEREREERAARRQEQIEDARAQAEIERINTEREEANRRVLEASQRRPATPARNTATLQRRNGTRNTATPPATPGIATPGAPRNTATPVAATVATPNTTPQDVAAPEPATPSSRNTATADTSHLEQVVEEAARNVAADNDQPLLTGAQVAKLKGVSPGTVRSWVNRGRLTPRSRDDNGHNLFHPADVAELD
ncbi:DUF2637 domain-containing protein [Streptomyces sp. NBRC 109706]|uniref:DUF2637 domain-containing protein n=1 Tax=Streptomyces sp. NBRC 109706 TaxID=1550035 RepID=UPI0007860B47|nr:DUF2637 domain-containing protein [Streptomyces sp. NBRC 109706]